MLLQLNKPSVQLNTLMSTPIVKTLKGRQKHPANHPKHRIQCNPGLF